MVRSKQSQNLVRFLPERMNGDIVVLCVCVGECVGACVHALKAVCAAQTHNTPAPCCVVLSQTSSLKIMFFFSPIPISCLPLTTGFSHSLSSSSSSLDSRHGPSVQPRPLPRQRLPPRPRRRRVLPNPRTTAAAAAAYCPPADRAAFLPAGLL